MPKTSLSGQFLFTMHFADEKEIQDMIDFLEAQKKAGKYPLVYVTHRDIGEPLK